MSVFDLINRVDNSHYVLLKNLIEIELYLYYSIFKKG